LFTLGGFFITEITQIFGLIFTMDKILFQFWQKMSWGMYILGYFVKNSSGHPAGTTFELNSSRIFILENFGSLRCRIRIAEAPAFVSAIQEPML
jgi:hypothetical protein